MHPIDETVKFAHHALVMLLQLYSDLIEILRSHTSGRKATTHTGTPNAPAAAAAAVNYIHCTCVVHLCSSCSHDLGQLYHALECALRH